MDSRIRWRLDLPCLPEPEHFEAIDNLLLQYWDTEQSGKAGDIVDMHPPDPRFDADFFEGFVTEVSNTLKDKFSPVFRQHEHIVNICFLRLKKQLEWNGLQSWVQLESTPLKCDEFSFMEGDKADSAGSESLREKFQPPGPGDFLEQSEVIRSGEPCLYIYARLNAHQFGIVAAKDGACSEFKEEGKAHSQDFAQQERPSFNLCIPQGLPYDVRYPQSWPPPS